MDFSTALQGIKSTVDKELQSFFGGKRAEAQTIHPQTLPLVDAVADFTLRGGKRTRAFLVWLGYVTTSKLKIQTLKFSKGKTSKNLITAMMGIELFESFALIHDDIMDEDTIRRGGPTVHQKFKVESLKYKVKNAKHFGESMAILAGDLALVWADELMGSFTRQASSVKPEKKTKLTNVVTIYQKMKQEVMYGQSLDVLSAAGMPSAPRPTINAYKTAWYTVIRPLQLGASVGGSDDNAIDAFVPYGLAVGEGYQLRDDFLDGEITEEVFRRESAKHDHDATQAAHAIQAPEGVASLFIDFAHFALHRPS